MIAAIKLIISIIMSLPAEQKKEIIDSLLDEIERRNVKHTSVMAMCRAARILTGVPDDDIDQENPI